MAIKYWLGTDAVAPTDYNDVDNWSPVGVPIAADDIIFGVLGGNRSCLINLDQSLIIPASVRVTAGYSGSIGAAGNTLRYNYLSDLPGLLYEGQGTEAWFEFVHAVNATNVVIMGTGGGANALHLDAAAGGMYISAFKGKGITIDAGAVVQAVYIWGASTDVTLMIGTGATLSSITQQGGVLTSASGAIIYAGWGGAATFTGAAAFTTADLYESASLTWNSTGAITTLSCRKTTSFNASASSGCTITTLYLYEKAFVDLENGSGTIIVTNPIRCYDRGEATLIIEAGRTLTLNAL